MEAAFRGIQKAAELIGITSFFANFVTIAVLMLAWLIVLMALAGKQGLAGLLRKLDRVLPASVSTSPAAPVAAKGRA